MRHARAAALDDLEPVLAELRRQDQLVERSRGVFYRRSRAFLHFHEDPSGLFVDVRLDAGAGFTRMRVSDEDERARLLAAVRSALA